MMGCVCAYSTLQKQKSGIEEQHSAERHGEWGLCTDVIPAKVRESSNGVCTIKSLWYKLFCSLMTFM